MIERADVMPMLLSACPSFLLPWQEYIADRMYEEELLYVHLGEFCRHLISRYEANATDEFDAVFQAVESLHTAGDQYVREAATIGILEGIQHHAEHAGLDPGAFVTWLGPESSRWWKKLNQFWGGDPKALRE